MKAFVIIIFLASSILSFGQDSLTTGVLSNSIDHSLNVKLFKDGDSIRSKSPKIKKKPIRHKNKKGSAKPNSISHKKDLYNNNNGATLLGLLVITIIVYLFFTSSKNDGKKNSNLTRDNPSDYVSDYFSRLFMSRRDYYREVYLKSDAWKRKRYVVMKRDNWKCVYCGNKATQVHHTRYAKINIGKEPIDWLISICKSCHNSIHK